MSQSELARLAKLGRGTISNIMSGNRQVGQDTISAIARALKLPPETVFRAAGILPPQTPAPSRALDGLTVAHFQVVRRNRPPLTQTIGLPTLNQNRPQPRAVFCKNFLNACGIARAELGGGVPRSRHCANRDTARVTTPGIVTLDQSQ